MKETLTFFRFFVPGVVLLFSGMVGVILFDNTRMGRPEKVAEVLYKIGMVWCVVVVCAAALVLAFA